MDSSADGGGGSRGEPARWLELAGKLLAAQDLVGCKCLAERAVEADPNLPGADELVAVVMSSSPPSASSPPVALLQLQPGPDPTAAARPQGRAAPPYPAAVAALLLLCLAIFGRSQGRPAVGRGLACARGRSPGRTSRWPPRVRSGEASAKCVGARAAARRALPRAGADGLLLLLLSTPTSRRTEFKFELESIKAKYLELQQEMDALQKQVERSAPSPAAGAKAGVAGGENQGPSAWSSGWRKLPGLLIL